MTSNPSTPITDRFQSDFDQMFPKNGSGDLDTSDDRMARRAVEGNVAADRPAPSRYER